MRVSIGGQCQWQCQHSENASEMHLQSPTVALALGGIGVGASAKVCNSDKVSKLYCHFAWEQRKYRGRQRHRQRQHFKGKPVFLQSEYLLPLHVSRAPYAASLPRNHARIAGFDAGWNPCTLDEGLRAYTLAPTARCLSTSTRSSAVTSPPRMSPPPRSTACAFLRPTKLSQSRVSGIS